MCAVSFVGDKYGKIEGWPTWPTGVPFPNPTPLPDSNPPRSIPTRTMILDLDPVTRKEFDALRKEVETLKTLLQKARAEDIANGEPDCEMEDKVAIIKQIADMFGVDLTGVFPNE